MFNALNMGGGGMGLGGFGVPAAVANPETAYATQLEQLRVRSFTPNLCHVPDARAHCWVGC